MARRPVSEFKTESRSRGRARKPLWVTGPSRVQISPSPLPSGSQPCDGSFARTSQVLFCRSCAAPQAVRDLRMRGSRVSPGLAVDCRKGGDHLSASRFGEVQMSWNPYDNLPRAASFSLTSSDLREGEKLAMPQVSGVFGAGGQDVSPQLSWSGFPSGTKSFVVTMVDPEAPTVLGFWHWAVVNIPGSVTELPTGAGDESGSRLPQGAFQLPNDARSMRYVGAAPPPGTGKHRYIFAVLALEAEKIEIDRGATPAWLMYMVFNGTLGRAFLEGWYER